VDSNHLPPCYDGICSVLPNDGTVAVCWGFITSGSAALSSVTTAMRRVVSPRRSGQPPTQRRLV
jgi:hypothetical protein